ncbi:hypothetical protein C8A01DRAFT_51411 [Parachaetomium inaequale]|uniref:Uncharacterized protein n=1 Tax=Parachaetomium inaequale TaxID=2588326 RepID=A0AAN6P6B0_9PEZI|nr:hypothetical protein C8A01DRAFT_51411 [Parachaetomium inaequale]
MSSRCPPVPERSSARTNQTGVESNLPAAPKQQVAKYCDTLNEDCIARLDLGEKYNDLQRQYRSLLLDIEKNTSDYLSKLDEETLRNDILSFRLDLAQSEAAEHQDTIKTMTEKLRAASQNESNLAGAVKEMESKLTEKDIELATVTSQMAEKDSIIEHLEGAYTLSNDLRVQKQITAEHIEQLEREKAAAISDRDTAAAEIRVLKTSYEEYESYINRLRQKNKTLEGDFEALIDMSIESETIQGGFAEENKRLTAEAANLSRDIDLIRAAPSELQGH